MVLEEAHYSNMFTCNARLFLAALEFSFNDEIYIHISQEGVAKSESEIACNGTEISRDLENCSREISA